MKNEHENEMRNDRKIELMIGRPIIIRRTPIIRRLMIDDVIALICRNVYFRGFFQR